METKGSGRRRFLKQAAALAGVAAGAGAEWAARGQSGSGALPPLVVRTVEQQFSFWLFGS